MSEKGECLDNAVVESFFGTYKAELLADQPQGRFASKAEAVALTADYINGFYNTVRLHSAIALDAGLQKPSGFRVDAPQESGRIENALIFLSTLVGQVQYLLHWELNQPDRRYIHVENTMDTPHRQSLTQEIATSLCRR